MLRYLMPFAALIVIVTTPVSAQTVGPPIGTQVGADFAAVDALGKPQTLRSIAGGRGTVLVFFRSAKWCPYCQAQLRELKTATAPLAAKGYALAAISYDTPDTLKRFATKHAIAYPMLSDSGSTMIDAFGLRDPQYPVGNFAHGVPLPAVFVIDRTGVVQAKLSMPGYKVRPTVAAIVGLVDTVPTGR